MKKTFLSLLCLAAAAMTFTACSDVDEFEPNKANNNTLTVIAGNPQVESDTRTQLEIGENGAIAPYWSKGDHIYMIDWNTYTQNENVSDDRTKIPQFFTSNSLNEFVQTAQFTFDKLNTDLQENDPIHFLYAKNLKLANGKPQAGIFYENHYISADIPNKMTPESRSDFSEGDILISENNKTYQSDILNVRFKRHTSVVKMVIKKATEDLVESNDYIKTVELSDYDFKLAGYVDYSVEEDRFICSDPDKHLTIDVSKFNYRFNGNDGFVFSCAPVSKKEMSNIEFGKDNITFTVTTNSGRKFVKKVSDLKDKNFELRPGTINTISLTLSKDNEVIEKPADPDALIYEPGSGIVTIQKPGTLKKDDVIKIVGSTNRIKIDGKMSDSDMEALKEYLFNNPNPCAVDLSDVSLCDDQGNSKTVIGGYFIKFEHKVSELILPNSITELQEWAIKLSVEDATLVVGSNVTKFGSFCISNGASKGNNNYNVVIKAPYKNGITTIPTNPLQSHINGDFKLHQSWKESPHKLAKSETHVIWSGFYYAYEIRGKAYYIDDNGNETLVTLEDLKDPNVQ